MAFTMSYNVIPPPVPTKTLPKVMPSKKSVLHRAHKDNNLQAQAQALFDPAPAQTSEVPSRPAAMNVPENGAALPPLPEEDAAAQSTPAPSRA